VWNLQVGSSTFLLEAAYQLSFIFLCEATGCLFLEKFFSDFSFIFYCIYYIYDIDLKNPSFSVKIIYKNKKALQQGPKGLRLSWLPGQNDYRTFCMSEETEKVYQKLEEVMIDC